MQFLKGIWSFLVGVKNALVLLAMLLFFGILWMIIASGERPASISSGSALNIEMSGLLVDQSSDPTAFALVSGEPIIPEIETAALVRVIDMAAKDSDIQMITLDLNSFLGGGQANLETVGSAIKRFRKTGKKVEAWATAYADDGYYLASHADHIAIAPMGAVMLMGPGGNNLYFKEALDKLKVNVEVFRVGTYKSFVEPFTRTEASPEAKAANQVLADDIWSLWRARVEQERPQLNIQQLIESWPARIQGANQSQAELAKSVGLVDSIQSEAQWHASLVKRLGPGRKPKMPGDYKRVGLTDYWNLKAPLNETGPAVAVVHVNGSIVDGEAPNGQAGGDTVSRLIYDAITHKDVKAIVVRVDSGGGSALASEQIRQAMLDARAKNIPVVASFGSVAASGGYWIGAGAQKIFASPSTITGSIGVFGIIPTFERTLADYGVHTDGIATTPYSGQPDVVGGLNEPTRNLIQSGVQDVYGQFLNLVADARSLPLAEVAKVAEGRVWSGAKAKGFKLVDAYGDLDAAVAEASRMAGSDKPLRAMVMRPSQPLIIEALQMFGMAKAQSNLPQDAMANAVMASRLRAANQVAEAVRVAKGPTVQAHCLTCTSWRAAPPAAQEIPSLIQAAKQFAR